MRPPLGVAMAMTIVLVTSWPIFALTTNQATTNVGFFSKNSSPLKSLGSFIDETEDQLISELIDNRDLQRNITPYQAMAEEPHNIREYKNASGNWFGKRDYLHEHGIEFSTTYTADIAGNPVGGKIPGGFKYADNFSFACFIETEKLFGWRGGYFMMSTLQRDGYSLTKTNIKNQFRVQQVADGYTFKWYEMAYQQDFFNNRWSFKSGRLGVNSDFANSPLYWLYMSYAIDGTVRGLSMDGLLPNAPNAVWGSRLKVNLTSTTAARLGIYQMTKPSVNGLNWDFYPDDGVLLMGQYSWNPEFCKPTTMGANSIFTGSRAVSKKETAEKTFKKPVDPTKLKALPGHYWMGGYYSTYEYSQFTSSVKASNSYGFYWHADQTIYRPNPLRDEGLVLWTAYELSPEQNISIIPFQANGGAIYTGLIPGRQDDFTILGVACGTFSSYYAEALQNKGHGYATYELIYELAYRINFTKFAYFQPDLQWIINPAGTGQIPNALVLGAQIGVIF
ncbi:MAG: carbohydrate porin [Chthoniobacterales bacterium]|nr:carbohydrate porin [Chthoniobacterales bacterium]